MCTQQNQIQEVGGLFKFYLWAQPSRQCPGNRKFVCNTCVHNKAMIIIIKSVSSLPIKIGCCKGQVLFSYHFTHFDIGCRDLPFHLRLVILCWRKMPSHSLKFLWNWDLICFQQSYWPLWAHRKSFLRSSQNMWRSPFEDGPKNILLPFFIFFYILFYRTLQTPPPPKYSIISEQFSAHCKVAA